MDQNYQKMALPSRSDSVYTPLGALHHGRAEIRAHDELITDHRVAGNECKPQRRAETGISPVAHNMIYSRLAHALRKNWESCLEI